MSGIDFYTARFLGLHNAISFTYDLQQIDVHIDGSLKEARILTEGRLNFRSILSWRPSIRIFSVFQLRLSHRGEEHVSWVLEVREILFPSNTRDFITNIASVTRRCVELARYL